MSLTGGGSTELRFGGKPWFKELFLTVDLGLSENHKGVLGLVLLE